MKIFIIFVGALHDRGFNQSALDGATRMQAQGKAKIEIVSGVPYDVVAMTQALDQAAQRSDGIVFIGGQGNLVVPKISASYPQKKFAIVQGNVTAANLASYDVLQEQSAFLAGVAAARLTCSGIVGHLSGHRVAPGLKGRAAFSAGLRHANDGIDLITGFCGTQDDNSVTEAWVNGIAKAEADILFTMLNGARDGASAACRATGMRQIGNATNWCAVDPKVFIASAVTRIDLGVERAVRDMLADHCPIQIDQLGLADGAVALTFAPDVAQSLRDEVKATAGLVIQRKLKVGTSYDGPEFEGPA